jgi:hypothetical protein
MTSTSGGTVAMAPPAEMVVAAYVHSELTG